MMILFAALGVFYAAVCIWFTVRIVNRRERWAKRTFAVVISMPLLYVLSSGPMQTVAFRRHTTSTPTLNSYGNNSVGTQSTVDLGQWWPIAFAPLLRASEQSWGKPLNWYWRLFPICEASRSP